MRRSKMVMLAGLLFLFASWLTHAAEAPAQIQLKTGEMALFPFLEMVSEKLDMQIDASGLGDTGSEIITVPSTGPLSIDRAKAVVLTCLYLKGLTWIHDGATGLHRILRQRDARDQELRVITDASQLPDSDELVTYFIALQHIPAEHLARTFRSFMPANSRIIPDEATKSVLITDSAHNISKLRKLLKHLDTPEAAKSARDSMDARAKKLETACPEPASNVRSPSPWVLIALFSLIALVIGFLARGYVIRRIEGGL